MASERYPDWVRKFRPKGCIVKRKGAVYQVYTATSKRVPGKKYPVVEVGEMVGTIDPSGFHGKTRMVIDFMSMSVISAMPLLNWKPLPLVTNSFWSSCIY